MRSGRTTSGNSPSTAEEVLAAAPLQSPSPIWLDRTVELCEQCHLARSGQGPRGGGVRNRRLRAADEPENQVPRSWPSCADALTLGALVYGGLAGFVRPGPRAAMIPISPSGGSIQTTALQPKRRKERTRWTPIAEVAGELFRFSVINERRRKKVRWSFCTHKSRRTQVMSLRCLWTETRRTYWSWAPLISTAIGEAAGTSTTAGILLARRPSSGPHLEPGTS